MSNLVVKRERPMESQWDSGLFDWLQTANKYDPLRSFGPLRSLPLMPRDMMEGGLLSPQMREWAPRLDVRETDNALIIHADLPGVEKDALNVSVQDNNLMISGEKKYEKVDDTERFHRVERKFGSYYRSIPLPEGIDASQVNAKYDNGVLEVTIPKPVSKQQKRIRVNVSGGGEGVSAKKGAGAGPAKGGK